MIATVGMGYVGLLLMLRFSEKGYRVIGIDIDQSKVERLDRGESYIQHISGPRRSPVRSNVGLRPPPISGWHGAPGRW